MHDIFMEKVQELHTCRQQTFGWAKNALWPALLKYFDMLALLFGIPSLIISDLPTFITLSSNPI